MLRAWLRLRLQKAGDSLSNENMDLSDPRTATIAHRIQGEVKLLRYLSDPKTEDAFIDELERLANPAYDQQPESRTR